MKFRLFAVSIAVIAILIVASLATAVPISGSSTNDVFVVKDGMGHSCTFDGPVDKIISIGKGPTSTIIRMGYIGKIVVTDSYSATSSEKYLRELKPYINEGKITAGGNMYSSGIEQLKTEIIDAADSGKFNKNSDAVIITGGGDINTKDLYNFLRSSGFNTVLTWTSADSYEEIIEFVESLSKIVNGAVTEDAEQMTKTVNYINNKLSEAGITPENAAKCFAIRYSSSNWQVSNYGSLATSMMMKAGGKVVTLDHSKKDTYYSIVHPSELISKYGTDVVVFTDSTISGKTLENLRIELGNEVKMCPMDPLWNNYGLESMEGIWVMACALYPDLFHGDIPVVPERNTNMIPHICAAIVSVALISAIGIFFMTRRS